MFTLNKIDPEGNITVSGHDAQAKLLEAQIRNNPDADTLICHSQGCIVASLADLRQIKRVIFLAPAADLNIERFMGIFDRPGASINLDGESSIPRRDGTTTYIGKDYVEYVRTLDVPKLYKKLAQHVDLYVIRATNDEILGTTDFNYLDNVEIIDLPANHDFTGKRRQELIKVLQLSL